MLETAARSGAVLLPLSAPALAVEDAIKMSPEPLPWIEPIRPMPKLTRFTMRLNWSGVTRASVARTTMIAPCSASSGNESLNLNLDWRREMIRRSYRAWLGDNG